MTISRGTTLSLAVCAALLVAGTADAGSKKRAGRAADSTPVASMPAPATCPANSDTVMDPAVGLRMGMGMAGPGPGAGPAGEPFIVKHFDDIDTDKSGQLSRAEVETWAAAARDQMRQRAEDHIKAADTNSDGQISKDEAKSGLPRVYEHFDFLDANGDGQITKAEFERLRDPAAMRAEILARLKKADADDNAKLDLNEVQFALPALAARFTQLDKDGDGFLTLADFAKLMGPR